MFPVFTDFLSTLRGRGLEEGMAIKTTRLQGKQGVPVQDGSRAPYAHRGRCDKVSRVDRYSKAGEGSVHYRVVT